jgi:hypothetical protein
MRKAEAQDTLDEIEDGRDPKCPICGTGAWNKTETDLRLQTSECVARTCNYCGFVRLHAIQELEKHTGRS